MNDAPLSNPPGALAAIEQDTRELGFGMASEPRTGALLRALAASKPGGRFLEVGTGTGIGTSWILAGMDSSSRLDSIDNDQGVLAVARRHLDSDSRVTFHLGDGAAILADLPAGQFDFIYADAWPGKFTDLEAALSLMRGGGLYVIDDLLPQTNWPDGHAAKVAALIADLEARADYTSVRLAWASGLMILTRRSRTAGPAARRGCANVAGQVRRAAPVPWF